MFHTRTLSSLSNYLHFLNFFQTQPHSLSKRRSVDASTIGDTSQQSNHLLMSVFSALHLVREVRNFSIEALTVVQYKAKLLHELLRI